MSSLNNSDERAASNVLWYRAPAEKWVEALPLGNGSVGAMVYGGVQRETIKLNEASLWSGKPVDKSPHIQDGAEVLSKVRKAVFDGDYEEADRLAQLLQGPWGEAYMPLGTLTMEFIAASEPHEDYARQLDLDSGTAAVRYRQGGSQFEREVFVSAPDQVMVVRLTSSTPGSLSFDLILNSPLKSECVEDGAGVLLLTGCAPSVALPEYLGDVADAVAYGENDEGGVHFAARLKIVLDDGDVRCEGARLEVRNASSVTILLSAATNFAGFDKTQTGGHGIPAQKTRDILNAANSSYQELLDRHIADYSELYRRVSLNLGNAINGGYATDERLNQFETSQDPAFAALLFNYGRYLLIASSRKGAPPANLQGVWNESVRPPWSSNYTININTEMNYWMAESCALPECHLPLFDWLQGVAANGRLVAEECYGARGWCAHHNSDLWAFAHPVGNGEGWPGWSNWPMGGAWLCRHLWEHYEYGGDIEFLRQSAWPILRGAAEFLLDFLVRDPEGYLSTNPSTSPEHAFLGPDGKSHAISFSTTMDLSIIRDLFDACRKASSVLQIDSELATRIESAEAELRPIAISKDGRLQEWAIDFEDPEPEHRHTSHLYGLHPGNIITDLETPDYFAAARKSLEGRGDWGTGWALAWKINFWARLRDGDHAYRVASNLLRPALHGGVEYTEGAGLYPNLFDAHPPFQIDGNFGFTSGIVEMLVQSHAGYIDLLPAVPSVWPRGSICGVRVKGGFTLDIFWEDGKIASVKVESRLGNKCRVRYGDALAVTSDGNAMRLAVNEYGIVEFGTVVGGVYDLVPAVAS
jgi:alpha-L-fucosidase 2